MALCRPKERRSAIRNSGCMIKICSGHFIAIKSMNLGDCWALSIILSHSASLFRPFICRNHRRKIENGKRSFIKRQCRTRYPMPLHPLQTGQPKKMECHKSTLMELKWNYACEWWTSKSVDMYSSKKQMKFWLHISQLHNSACIRTSSHIPVYHWEFTWTARKMSTMHLPFPHFVSF